MSVPATQRKLRAHHPIFDRIIKRCHALKPVSTAVAWPLSEVALRGADEAARAGIIDPHLIGPLDDIRSLAREQNVSTPPSPTYRCRHFGIPCRECRQ